jgi:DNA mismatch endonuclease (patch repair protein)
MVDSLTQEARSALMARIRSRDTKPELLVRSIAHRLGFRFSLHREDLPGSPDLVFPKFRAVIFVHGCFWHRHGNCAKASVPATRTLYWLEKFRRNVERDDAARRGLRRLGWRVLTIWECEIRDESKTSRKIGHFLRPKGRNGMPPAGRRKRSGGK